MPLQLPVEVTGPRLMVEVAVAGPSVFPDAVITMVGEGFSIVTADSEVFVKLASVLPDRGLLCPTVADMVIVS